MVDEGKEQNQESNEATSKDKGKSETRSQENFSPGIPKNIIEQAREERELIKKEREALAAERERFEKTAAAIELGGKSVGTKAPPKTEHEIYEERAAERYKGTGMDPAKGYKRRW